MPGILVRSDWDAERVRRAARLAEDAAQVRRLLSIAAIYDGMSRAEAARLGGMDRQTLRDWVHRFNAAGPLGLVDRTAPGAAARLNREQEAELATLDAARPLSGSRGGTGPRDGWRCALALHRPEGADPAPLRR